MGSFVSQICSPCGGSKPAPQSAGLAIAGYEWEPATASAEPAANGVTNGVTTAPKEAPPPAVKAAPPPESPKPKIVPTTPIVLETLQGNWVNSIGAKIGVTGTEVSLNGMVMKVHPVMLNEDGTVSSIGRIWQLKGWVEEGCIEFKEAPSREVMEYARSVVWTQATAEKMEAWTVQMAGLGYAGSSQDPMKRGVEGCCPGTCDAKAKIADDDSNRDKAELAMLNKLISDWRYKELRTVPPRLVIPDFSNRGHTGLSVEHVHYLATSFKEKGFQRRLGNKGHDIPVLVAESSSSDLGQKSIANWRSKLADEPGFPPKEHYERLFSQTEIYTSLGNGHFNQALNLFGNECESIYSDKKYTFGFDEALREAVEEGVSSIVLRKDIPLRDRETVSRLLNSKREYKWNVRADGAIDILDAAEDTSQCKQFEALSKVLDAVELNCLVRAELGVKDSTRIGQ